MARFLNVGKNRRPKYEVIGNQDLSTGIHRVNNVPESLAWKSDKYVFYNYISQNYIQKTFAAK